MQRHRRVEIGLPAAHSHRNSNKLRHLARIVPENVHAEHLIRGTVDDDFHHHFFFAAGERRFQRPEMRAAQSLGMRDETPDDSPADARNPSASRS